MTNINNLVKLILEVELSSRHKNVLKGVGGLAALGGTIAATRHLSQLYDKEHPRISKVTDLHKLINKEEFSKFLNKDAIHDALFR